MLNPSIAAFILYLLSYLVPVVTICIIVGYGLGTLVHDKSEPALSHFSIGLVLLLVSVVTVVALISDVFAVTAICFVVAGLTLLKCEADVNGRPIHWPFVHYDA